MEPIKQATMGYIYNTIADAEDPDEMQERARLISNELDYFLKDQGIPRVIFFRALMDDQSIRQQLVNLLTGSQDAEQGTLLDLVIDAQGLTLSDALSDYENGVTLIYQYDAGGRLLAEGHHDGSNKSWDLCYLYDDWGRLSKMGMPTDKTDFAGTCTAILAEYRYDHRGRRVATRHATSVAGYSFSGRSSQVALYDDADRLVATAGEGSGTEHNLVVSRQYVYLGARPLAHLDLGHLTPLISQCQLYGPTGKAAAAAGALWFCLVPVVIVRVRRSRRLSRATKNAVSVVLLAVLVPLPAALLACTMTPLSSPAVYYYHTDATLLPVQVTDQNRDVKWQALYDDSGAVEKEDILADAARTPLRFPGQIDDNSKALVGSKGPYYNYHRYYDPMIGRYTTADPIGLWGGENLYSYAGGDPINNVDPFGLEFQFTGRVANENMMGCMTRCWNDINMPNAEAAIIAAAIPSEYSRKAHTVEKCTHIIQGKKIFTQSSLTLAEKIGQRIASFLGFGKIARAGIIAKRAATGVSVAGAVSLGWGLGTAAGCAISCALE